MAPDHGRARGADDIARGVCGSKRRALDRAPASSLCCASLQGSTMSSVAKLAAAAIAAVCGVAHAAEPACDRACLVSIADAYLAAVAAHDPKKAPLSDEIVFVENVKRTRPGQGLWADATAAATAFRIYVSDAASR